MVNVPYFGRSTTSSVTVPSEASGRFDADRIRHLAWTTANAITQLVLLGGLFMVYRLSRHLADGRESVALRHAKDVWHLQHVLYLPSEEQLQRLALHSTELIRLANQFYIGVHFPAALAFLVWVLVRHHDHWARVRNVLIVVTGAALAIHIAYPLAPPRFLPQVLSSVDFVDTGTVIGPSAYQAAGDKLANEYAAMPSLHVGWAILEAWGIIIILRTRARWLAVLHPVVTLLVVVVTANHYWMDGIVAAGLVAGAVRLTAPGVVSDLRSRVTHRGRVAASAEQDPIVPATARGIVAVPGARQAPGQRHGTAAKLVPAEAATTDQVTSAVVGCWLSVPGQGSQGHDALPSKHPQPQDQNPDRDPSQTR